jgi:uncharacterized protein (DUF934 family)
MPMLIRLTDGVFSQVQDDFVRLGDDEPVAGGDVIVSLGRLLTGDVSRSGGGRIGVWLEPADEVEALAGRLDEVDLVALAFPKFRDGRAFTSARLLRERLGFTGEVRAVGDVLQDQAGFMIRCGFNAFSPADGSTVEAWAAAAGRHRHVYQRAADGRAPAFAHRGSF